MIIKFVNWCIGTMLMKEWKLFAVFLVLGWETLVSLKDSKAFKEKLSFKIFGKTKALLPEIA